MQIQRRGPCLARLLCHCTSNTHQLLQALSAGLLTRRRSGQPDPPTLLSVPTPQHFVLATDSSALHIYDIRLPTVSPKPQQTHSPHIDYVSSLTPLPPSDCSKSGSPRQFLTTGDTTIAITDLRKGIITQSENFGEELLSSALVGDKIVMGSEKGVLRVWEVGKWDDEPERIHVGGRDTESADVLSAVSEELRARLGFAEGGVIAGMGDGSINIVRLGKGKAKVVGEIRHDEIEPVGGLAFEVGGRMVSGGGTTVKVWEQATTSGAQDDGYGKVLDGESSDDGSGKEDDKAEDDEDSSDEEEKQKKRKKRRKRGKGKPNTESGIMGFKGMD